MLDVLYLVPNTADSAVARRIDMLNEGGARVSLAGFRRADTPAPQLEVESYSELGVTFDARFMQRIVAVLGARRSIRAKIGGRAVPDVIIARNLEMLVLANHLRGFWGDRPSIVYECLDIHRLLLSNGTVGRLLRALERGQVRDAALLVTSSPAFLSEYFDAYSQTEVPALLVENRVHTRSDVRGVNPALRSDGSEPIRIGWFGALRCSRSLDILSQFAREMQGDLQVVLRGRPALTEFEDFHGVVSAHPHMSYEGTYRNPHDLPSIYSDVHFAWAIDYFEEGQNSNWLLPNRIYEGCLHGAIPIALAGTETAAFLERHGIGVILPDTSPQTLRGTLGSLTPQAIRELAEAVAGKHRRLFATDADDCRALVARLAEAAGAGGQLQGVAA